VNLLPSSLFPQHCEALLLGNNFTPSTAIVILARNVSDSLEAAAALLPAPTFYVDQTPLERVTKFRYLGRILSQDDHDLSACVRNIQRARAKWAAVSRVLKREGASKKSFARFYLVIVSTVLLYGSDTWVVTRRMEALLTSFHDRCLRHITKRVIRCTDTENNIWITPSTTGVLAEALLLNLRPAMYYVRARRNALLRYAITRSIYQRCLVSTRLSRLRTTFWNQLKPLQDLGV
jgi:hypothetical protein